MKPNLIKLSLEYINNSINNSFRTSRNKKFNNLLVDSFCKKIGVKYGVTVSSGTAGLHVALLSLQLKKNDEVIMPAITMSAVAYAIILSRAKPIFADVDNDTLNIDPKSVEKKITKKTKAIICVSLYGLPPNYSKLIKIIKKKSKKIFLIEDNAECMLGTHKNKFAGSFGDLSMFSFQASKILTCGEGGILVTNNKSLYLKAKMFSNLGYYISNNSYQKNRQNLENTNFKRHKFLGFNYRLSDLNAAVVYGQLKKIEYILSFRTNCGQKFSKIVEKFDFVRTQKFNENTHSYWAFALIFEKIRDYELFKRLFKKNNGDYFYGCWKLPYQEEFYKNLRYKKQTCEVAENLQRKIVQLKTNYFSKKELNKQCTSLEITFNQINELRKFKK